MLGRGLKMPVALLGGFVAAQSSLKRFACAVAGYGCGLAASRSLILTAYGRRFSGLCFALQEHAARGRGFAVGDGRR